MSDNQGDSHDLKNCMYNIRNCLIILKRKLNNDPQNIEIIDTGFLEIEKALGYIQKIQDPIQDK